MSLTAPKKTCIIIAGPTAVGKTGFAIELARHFKTDIISADSRQCYKELNIGVAKPSQEQLNLVKHYFIDSHSIAEDVNAGMYEKYALHAVNEIFTANNIAVITGGTGLYIKAFAEGMDEIPAAGIDVREQLNAQYQQKGMGWLQNEIKDKDPAWYATGEIQNPQRILRALEVFTTTGRSILSFRKTKTANRDFRIIKIGLELPREELYYNINTRVDAMIREGLVQEAEALMPYRNLNALQTVGYKELFDYFDGRTDLAQAIGLIKRNTRHYAKRQLTWFKKDESIQWFSSLDFSQVINHLKNLV